MISASHNSFEDNGIKLVNSKGEKIDDETIEKIEAYLDGKFDALSIPSTDIPFATGENVGKIIDYSAGRNRYIGYLISISRYSFKGFKVGLDCANGSSWMIAKSVFEALGAKVYAIGTSPDGTNINRGVGSTHIEHLAEFVKENALDIGFAFDGDADRCIAVDERGEVINGDHILYILAKEMKANGQLANNTVVTTIMSNMGLYLAFDAEGIEYVSTKVGDRYVYENLQSTGNCLGGEQSGHVIIRKYATTGDGILTAIKVMEAVVGSKLPLSKVAEDVKMLPQVLKNVKVSDKNLVMTNDNILRRVDEISEKLSGKGRILLRESGTEPVIRVMVEAESIDDCKNYTDEVAALIVDLGLCG
jgi:phosphoglucosamine mutase